MIEARYAIATEPAVAVSDNVVRVGDVAIKTFAPAERDRAAREAALLAHLGGEAADYRVPALVRARDGATYVESDAGAHVVMAWRSGVKKDYTQIAEAEWAALGTSLAALHARLEDFAGAMPQAAPIDLAVERAGIVASRERARAKDPARGDAIARYLDARLALLDARGERGLRAAPGALRPIHNDYNQHNYLFDGALPPVIIDWEGAIAATCEYEVVRCLNHLPLVAPAHAAAFVGGYRARRPLDAEGLRWAIDRALLEHAIKSWPIDRWLAELPGAEASLVGSMEVFAALDTGTRELAAFFGVRE